MNPNGPKSAANTNKWLIPAFLAVILLLCFWRSLVPGLVHFSNDGPLGAINSEWLRLPSGVFGMWDDLNTLGLAAGTFPPDVSTGLEWGLGPVGYAKFLVPITLMIVGLSAAFCFRRLKLAPLVCLIGSLAVAFNSAFLSTACWGVAPQLITFGMSFVAMGLAASATTAVHPARRIAQWVLAGFAVGIGVMEGADIGALFSMLVAAFVLVSSLIEDGAPAGKWLRGIGRTAIVAVFAGIMAFTTVKALTSTIGASGTTTPQEKDSKGAQWEWATQWSLPKKEALGFIVPGLFGYRMDTPDGGNYWGMVGSDPAWDRYFASGKQGSPPAAILRFSGGGVYAGASVVLIGLWAVAQSLRRKDPIYDRKQCRFIWFWSVVALGTLLLAFGRFAPFYQILYALPYFSTIRNPAKWAQLTTFALLMLFAYGIDGLARGYLQVAATSALGWRDRLTKWWAKASPFDKRWVTGMGLALAASVLGWLIFASSRPAFEQYLQNVQFDANLSKLIAGFSIQQVGWFVLFYTLAAVLLVLTLSGAFAGSNAKLGGILLGLVILGDLVRADQPWILYWDYQQKYATNPIIEKLKQKPYEQRVAILPEWLDRAVRAPQDWELIHQVYRIEWAQHHFPYFNIQSLDIVQMPRMPEDLKAYETALQPRGPTDVTRRWELTNTRYLIGAAPFLEALNTQFDPVQHRFRIVEQFQIVPKPGITRATKLEELTAAPATNGTFALFEFTGALPRAKLYGNWQVATNDQAVLSQLANPAFDPEKTVFVSVTPSPGNLASSATNANAGSVEFTSYAPKHLVFKANALAPSVLLLNDRYDANWTVTVDGQPANLLRCNFIMRGVQLSPGTHTVEFKFALPVRPLYVSLAAIAVGVLLCGLLVIVKEPEETREGKKEEGRGKK